MVRHLTESAHKVGLLKKGSWISHEKSRKVTSLFHQTIYHTQIQSNKNEWARFLDRSGLGQLTGVEFAQFGSTELPELIF